MGGNRNAITIFGESAGAFDIAFHLTQKSSYPFYSKAIMESYGNTEVVSDIIHFKDAESAYLVLLENTNCSNSSCMRGRSMQAILEAIPNGSKWAPVADKVHTFASPADLFARGEFNAVPVLLGSNREEMSIVTHGNKMMPGLPYNITVAELGRFWDTLPIPGRPLSSDEIVQVLQLYAPENYSYPEDLGHYSQAWWMATRIKTDVESTGACFARHLSKKAKVFSYLFAHPPHYKTQEILWSWFG